jgi:hypothetical protein
VLSHLTLVGTATDVSRVEEQSQTGMSTLAQHRAVSRGWALLWSP